MWLRLDFDMWSERKGAASTTLSFGTLRFGWRSSVRTGRNANPTQCQEQTILQPATEEHPVYHNRPPGIAVVAARERRLKGGSQLPMAVLCLLASVGGSRTRPRCNEVSEDGIKPRR